LHGWRTSLVRLSPPDGEIASCVIPLLQKLASKTYVGDYTMLQACKNALYVTTTTAAVCSGLSTDNPPAACAGVFH
jgi:hypothetical protein